MFIDPRENRYQHNILRVKQFKYLRTAIKKRNEFIKKLTSRIPFEKQMFL